MCSQDVPAAEVVVDSLVRLEGASDPGDMAAVVAVTCPHCSSKDVLVLRYGPEASEADADVLVALPDLPQPPGPGGPDGDGPGRR